MKTQTRQPMRARSLTATLGIAFLALSVVVLLISSILQIFSNLQTQQAAIANQQQFIAQDAARVVSNDIQEKFSVLETAVRLANPATVPQEGQRRILAGLLGLQPAFRQLVVLNTQDQESAQISRLGQSASRRLTDQISRDLLTQSRQGKKYIGPVYFDPVTMEPLVAIAVPATNALGDFQGTLVAEVNLKFMWNLVDQLKVGKTGWAYVVNGQGNLIAFGDTARVLQGENVQNLEKVSEFMSSSAPADAMPANLITGIKGTTVVGTYVPLGTPDWAVVTELPWQEAYRQVIQVAVVSLGVTLVVVVLAGLVGTFLARRLAVPLVNLTETATRIADGETGLQAAVGGPSEVARLATAFNSMTAQLRQSLESLEQQVVEVKQAEESLRRANEALQALIDYSPLAIMTLDLDGHILLWNNAAEEMYGWTAQQVLGEFPPFLPEDKRQEQLALRERVNREGILTDVESEGRRKDGSRILNGVSIAPLRDSTGSVYALMSIATDITERKRVEEAVREEQQRTRMILETVAVPMLISRSSDGKVLYANPALAQVGRVDLDEFMSARTVDYYADRADQDKIVETLQRQGHVSDFEVQLQRGDGELYWALLSARLINYQNETCVLSSFVDITERKRVEEALMRINKAVESSSDAIAMSDVQGHHFYHNKAFTELFEYTPEELETVEGGSAAYANKNVARKVFDTIMSGGSWSGEVEMVSKSGRKFPVLLRADAMKDESGKLIGLVEVHTDITERKQAEEKFRKLADLNQTILDTASVGITFVVDRKTQWANRAFINMFGFDQDETFGAETSVFYANEDDYERIGTEGYPALARGEVSTNEVLMKRKDGGVFWVSLNGKAVDSGKPFEGSIWVLQDITEQKLAEAQLERALRETRVRYEVSQALAGAETEDEVLDGLIQHTSLYPQAHVSLFTFDRAEGKLVVLRRVDRPELRGRGHPVPVGVRIPASRMPVTNFYSADQPFVSNDVFADERVDLTTRETFRQSGMHGGTSLAVFPLTAGNEWLGYIVVAAESTGYFDEEKLHLYQTLAEQGAVALRAARLRETIRESQQRLSLLVEQSPLAVIEWDMDFQGVSWNPAAERIFGYTRQEALGRHASLIVPKQVRPLVDQVWQALLAQKGGAYSTNENLTKDGRTITCEWFNAPLVGADGQVVGVASLVQDITERKLSEQALKESEEKFKSLAEQSPNMIFINQRGKILYANERCEEIMGYTRKEFCSPDFDFVTIIAPEYVDLIKTKFAQHMRGEEVEPYEYALVTKGGKRIEAIIAPRLIDYAGESAILGTITDITERKQAEEEIHRLNEGLEQRVAERTMQLEAANKELEAFSYSISHDLRAPLRAMDGFSRIVLEDYAPQLPSEVGRYLKTIRESSQQMGRLIDDLLAFSRLSRQALDKQAIATADLVRQVLVDLRAEQEGRRVEIIVGDLPSCQADLGLLRQVWINLLSNALKYTRKCEVARLEIGCQEQEGKPVYFVKDNGAGFDMQYADKLFGVFQRLHSAEEYEGTGVGLAIVQRILHRHGGRIWAEAEVDQGATFWFTLG